MRRSAILVLATGLAVVLSEVAPQLSLAVLTDSDLTTASMTTDILDPPTGVAASGGLTVNLTWTPTVDAYASGYRLDRSTTSGSGYAQIADLTPRTVSATSDVPPAPGTYYYVLRSYFQSWQSAATTEVSATYGLPTVTTPSQSCAPGTSTAEAGWGDGNGYELLPDNACVDGLGVATDANTGSASRSISCANLANDAHRFRDFSVGLPGVVFSISGIELRADVGMNNNGGTSNLCAQLSWDGGTSWTAAESVALGSTAETTYLLGGAADTWGRTWTAAELSNANFRVRLVDASNQPNKNYLLDYVAIRVTYVP